LIKEQNLFMSMIHQILWDHVGQLIIKRKLWKSVKSIVYH